MNKRQLQAQIDDLRKTCDNHLRANADLRETITRLEMALAAKNGECPVQESFLWSHAVGDMFFGCIETETYHGPHYGIPKRGKYLLLAPTILTGAQVSDLKHLLDRCR